ncbi:MAG TPA: ribbon-helix-helix protein, CopG family [Thermoanaerobaculia bacterium]
MARRKVTFTVDQQTIDRLNDAAERTKKPKSEVVREAIADYHERIGKLSETERLRLIKIMEDIMSRPPTRPQEEVDRELAEIRELRRLPGRLHPVD